MKPYAARTTVPIEVSRSKIEYLLNRYGASAFGYHRDADMFQVAFKLMGRVIRLRLIGASRDDKLYRYLRGRKLTDVEAQKRADQETRRRWRALELVLKAKLEAVHSGVLSLEEEFLPYMQLSDGRTVSEWAVEGLKPALEGGQMPRPMLGSGS